MDSKLNDPNQFNQVTRLLNNISLISQNMLVHLRQKDKWRAEAKRQLEELEQLYQVRERRAHSLSVRGQEARNLETQRSIQRVVQEPAEEPVVARTLWRPETVSTRGVPRKRLLKLRCSEKTQKLFEQLDQLKQDQRATRSISTPLTSRVPPTRAEEQKQPARNTESSSSESEIVMRIMSRSQVQ